VAYAGVQANTPIAALPGSTPVVSVVIGIAGNYIITADSLLEFGDAGSLVECGINNALGFPTVAAGRFSNAGVISTVTLTEELTVSSGETVSLDCFSTGPNESSNNASITAIQVT